MGTVAICVGTRKRNRLKYREFRFSREVNRLKDESQIVPMLTEFGAAGHRLSPMVPDFAVNELAAGQRYGWRNNAALRSGIATAGVRGPHLKRQY
jgi:hypothetical protein